MSIALIGAGKVGQTLATAFVERGYSVRVGVPEPEKYRHLETALGERSITVGSVEEAIGPADVVILATPYGAALQIARSVPNWQGRVLVDVTNPIAPNLAGLLVGTTTSGAQEIAKAAPTARVVKAFNITGFENMRDPRCAVGDLFMPVAGDDPSARQQVMALAMLLGFDAVDLGPLKSARYLEPMAMVWIEMAVNGSQGRHFGFARLLTREAAR